MSLFSGLFKPDTSTEVAVVKQNAVFSLWKLQLEALDIFNRGAQANCVPQTQVQRWTQELNVARQAIQDNFLLAKNLHQVQERIQVSINQFQAKVDEYTKQVVHLEQSLDPEERIKNINENFKTQFSTLYEERKIERDTMAYLQSQVQMFSNSLRKNFENNTMRQSIKGKLLHELIDDYYNEIRQIYLEAISTRQRI